jgi:hypothetical protein
MVNQFFLSDNVPIKAPTQLGIAHPGLVETFQTSNRSVTTVAKRRSRSGRDVQRSNDLSAISHSPYTLPSSVSSNPCICLPAGAGHSLVPSEAEGYENSRGVGGFFPFWNRSFLCVLCVSAFEYSPPFALQLGIEHPEPPGTAGCRPLSRPPLRASALSASLRYLLRLLALQLSIEDPERLGTVDCQPRPRAPCLFPTDVFYLFRAGQHSPSLAEVGPVGFGFTRHESPVTSH